MKLRVKLRWIEHHSFEIDVPDGTPEDEWEDYIHHEFEWSMASKPVESECEIYGIKALT